MATVSDLESLLRNRNVLNAFYIQVSIHLRTKSPSHNAACYFDDYAEHHVDHESIYCFITLVITHQKYKGSPSVAVAGALLPTH